MNQKTRPPTQARFGSVCERLFGTTNTQFIHNLRGNTQITRNIWQVAKTNAPVGQAAWTLGRLHDYVSIFLFEIYDTIEHPALGQSPRDTYFAGLQNAGFRLNRSIPYDQAFLMAPFQQLHAALLRYRLDVDLGSTGCITGRKHSATPLFRIRMSLSDTILSISAPLTLL